MEAAERNEIREGNIQMLNMQELMAYLTKHHGIAVRPEQVQALRNLGYYHGFKGYRFVRQPSQRIVFSSLDEVIALNAFDMNLKALLYPKVMFIENALKSYVIEAVLMDSGSEYLDDIFNRSMTHYRSYTPGSESYQKQYAKRMTLKGKINRRLIALLEAEVGLTGLDFKYIGAYVILVAYVLRKMGESVESCEQFVDAYIHATDKLREQLSGDICNQILGTHQRKNMVQLRVFFSCTSCSCIWCNSVVYYKYELRWSSSDNTWKEPDASGSFFFYTNQTGGVNHAYPGHRL